jgi:bacteriochlorophyll 4-vinyl reductase
VVARAGEYAAEWTVTSLPALERRFMRALPLGLRARAALRTARSLVRATYPGSRAIVQVRKDSASVDLRGSLFCEVREASVQPLCGFYAAAITRVLKLFSVPGEAHVQACRAAGGGKGCLMSIVVRPAPSSEPAAA